MKKMNLLSALGLVLVFTAGTETASANLISNGDFSSGLASWVVTPDTTTGVTVDSGEARVGQPGKLGVAHLEQSFDGLDATSFSVQFEYFWQEIVNAGNYLDTFSVALSYEVSSTTIEDTFIIEAASAGNFTTPVIFDDIVTLSQTPDSLSSITIKFSLEEFNIDGTSPGTRVHLDDVVVTAVPVPATIWLLGSALVGFAGISRRRAAH